MTDDDGMKPTLTAEEIRIAYHAFTDPTGKMTNAEKERQYAMNRRKLSDMRKRQPKWRRLWQWFKSI